MAARAVGHAHTWSAQQTAASPRTATARLEQHASVTGVYHRPNRRHGGNQRGQLAEVSPRFGALGLYPSREAETKRKSSRSRYLAAGPKHRTPRSYRSLGRMLRDRWFDR